MFALDDLARLFELTVREDTLAGGLTIVAKGQTIVLTPGQSLASVGGRLVSLPARAGADGRRGSCRSTSSPRALAPSLGTRLELRKPSRLIVVGDVRVPRVAGRIEPLGALARLTLDVAPATPHTVVQEGQRLLVRFEADALDAALPASTAPDLIAGGPRRATRRRRIVDRPRSALRVVPRLGRCRATAAAAASSSTSWRRRPRQRQRRRGRTPPAPAPPAPAPTAPPLLDLAPPGGMRTIVDRRRPRRRRSTARRGPRGTLEKDVTLAVARRLKAALESAARRPRDPDARRRRARSGSTSARPLANNNKADLFISLHANASVRASAAGAEVFYLSLDEYGDQAQRVAQGESEALPVFGGGTRDIEVILWEMAQARHIEQSAALAQAVEAALRERVPMSPRAIQQAPFRVLVGANMPAVLVEMGFITNPEQEKQLALRRRSRRRSSRRSSTASSASATRATAAAPSADAAGRRR